MSGGAEPRAPRTRGDVQAAVAQGAIGFAVAGLGACVALLARDLDVPVARVAWLSSAFGAGLLLVAAAGRRLLAPGPHGLLRAAALVAAAGAALLAGAPSLPVAAAGALALGLGCAGLVLVTPALLRGRRATVRMARANAASSAAGVLAPLSMGALDAAGATGRLALLAVVPPLVVLGAAAGPGGAALPPAPAPPPPAAARAAAAPPGAAAGTARVFLAVSVEFCFYVWSVARLRDAGAAPAAAAALSAAFPVGMAAGRVAGASLADRRPVVPWAAGVSALGATAVALASAPVAVAGGLMVAGAGVALLYPVTLGDLVGTPGLPSARAISLGALASGSAVLCAPAALAAVSASVDLRTAFLITLPLLAMLVLLPPRGRGPARASVPRG